MNEEKRPERQSEFPHPSRVTVSDDDFMVTGLLPLDEQEHVDAQEQWLAEHCNVCGAANDETSKTVHACEDTGSPESGPGPIVEYDVNVHARCWNDERGEAIQRSHCYVCDEERVVVRTQIVNEKADPSTAVVLDCGHVMI